MKKIGVVLFIATLAVGLVLANFVSFGKVTGKLLNFDFKFGSVKGSGQTASEIREITGFKAVDVGGVFQVEITAQKDFQVEVEADDNLLPLIKTEVRNGVLRIQTEKKLSTHNPLRIRISAPNIDDLDVSGAANVTLLDVENESLNVDSSGASRIKVSGKSSRLSIDVSGATKIDAEDLLAETADVDASGACHVTVNVSGELRTDASGASKILYAGSPTKVEKRTNGASSVKPK